MNILCIANLTYIEQLYIFLYSLYDNNPTEINVYLIHSDIPSEELSKISNFSLKWENKHFFPIQYNLDFASDLDFSDLFPKEVYYRLLCSDILPTNVNKILSLDLDMIVTKPLEALYNTDISSYPLAACKDIFGYIFGEAQNNLSRLDLESSSTYFNSGTILFNLQYLRENDYGKKMINLANRISHKLKYYEQDILNCFFIDNYLELPWHMYNLTPVMYVMNPLEVEKGVLKPLYQQEISDVPNLESYADYTVALIDNSYIIHYIGNTKPWISSRAPSKTYDTFDIYYNYYKTQLKDFFNRV